jgi:hypothetical protein
VLDEQPHRIRDVGARAGVERVSIKLGPMR